MVFKNLKSGLKVADNEFDSIYPEAVRSLAELYFTPVEIAKIASQFLAYKAGMKILDIGSGAGKFCMIGATCTNGHFTGVEYRENLVSLAGDILRNYRLSNVGFIHSNITAIKFQEFNAFYYFNAFYENIDQSGKIDETIKLDRKLYATYAQYVKTQLANMPAGTRLATYFSYLDEIPASYEIYSKHPEEKLILWQKVI